MQTIGKYSTAREVTIMQILARTQLKIMTSQRILAFIHRFLEGSDEKSASHYFASVPRRA